MSVVAPACILGIDPGYGRLGFGVLRAQAQGDLIYTTCGVITTQTGTEMPVRLQEIANDFRELLRRHQPNLLVIEQLYFVQNITTGIKVAEVRGIIQLLAIEAQVPIVEVHPTEVKLALTGQGHADKHQMQKMITTLLRLERTPSPDDAADALAIAWAGERKYRYQQVNA
jgi:crossover junction endodeoxyribonuclease RuvC